MNKQSRIVFSVFAGLFLFPGSVSGQVVEVESFSTGDFSNPFFIHELEFNKPCCVGIENCDQAGAGEFFCELHLRPNTDSISFDLAAGEHVESVSIQIRDFEGGIVGDQPTSILLVMSRTDFVFLAASEIAVPTTLFADVNSIGQISGEPLGEIIQIQLQAANQGNSVVIGIGAFLDDLTATVVTQVPGDVDGDGVIGINDLLLLLADWGPCAAPCPPVCATDFDSDCSTGINDLLTLLANWG